MIDVFAERAKQQLRREREKMGAAAGAAVSSAAGVVGFSSSDMLITVYDAKCEYMVRL